MQKKMIKVILPDGNIVDIQLENELNITEYDDGKIFMLVDGQIIQDERHLHE